MHDRQPTPGQEGRVKITRENGESFFARIEMADTPLHEGTPLIKQTLLQDATAAMFGLSDEAVPDDVYAFLGKYNQHWWQKTAQETKTVYTDVRAVHPFDTVRFTFANVYYSDSYNLNPDTGEIALVNPSVAKSKDDIYGYYVKGTGSGVEFISNSTYTPTTDVFYVTKKTSNWAAESDEGIMFTDEQISLLRIYSVAREVNVGDSEFVCSSDRNTYPDSGIVNGYKYNYLGIPFDNAVTAPKIEMGSYAGTGVMGANNPNSLTFSFKPKVVLFTNVYNVSDGFRQDIVGSMAYSGVNHVQQIEDFPTEYKPGFGFGLHRSENDAIGKISEDGKTLYWYSNDTDHGAHAQFNGASRYYYYIAIG